jgi:hypothetical protein
MTAPCIRRYRIDVDGKPHTVLLTGDPLHVEAAGSTHVDFWALHTPGRLETVRTFQIFGTGHDLPAGARYIGTTGRTLASLIWHLFEVSA